jgi:N4-(beta-N-acetylglucosaminyl)-L-asparaginase
VISTWDFGVAANQAAWAVLSKGGRALDAVEAGARVPEQDLKNHSVGRAGYPDRDGHVSLDACIMDELGNCGAVAALEHIAHPISVARKVMEKTPHVMLVGAGALQFALEQGFPREELLTPESKRRLGGLEEGRQVRAQGQQRGRRLRQDLGQLGTPGGKGNHDTIGMLAIDAQGNMSGACTTSGMAWKMRGRVGDSPIIGAGLYVDNEVGGATSTGVGEEVIRNVGSFLVVELMRQGRSPEAACKRGRRAHPEEEAQRQGHPGRLPGHQQAGRGRGLGDPERLQLRPVRRRKGGGVARWRAKALHRRLSQGFPPQGHGCPVHAEPKSRESCLEWLGGGCGGFRS